MGSWNTGWLGQVTSIQDPGGQPVHVFKVVR
jgi:hypothetical protein